ncbi:single-stranded DNA-binding protein [Streptomyces sp. NPDC059524]|uniref:single-stranded DNA-binding protein n=1 Tax=Streptomyces sp. NPDC059524 TaxID=3346856 RepID=UPI0036C1DD47
MSLPTMNGTARLIEAPELRFSAQGKAIVKVRLAFNARRKDQVTGDWVDGDSFFVDGKAFDRAAENIAESLDKGMEVVVSGRLRTEKWETQQGEKRSATALLIDAIGPSLRAATVRVEKAGGSGQGKQDAYRAAQAASSREGMDDPWGSTPAAGGQQSAGGWGGEPEPPF